jgi:MYXO-CTERM domain-containing protein
MPGSLRADTIYTYTGEAYTTCTNTCGPLSITFATSLTGSALDSLSLQNITSTVTSWDFTDNSGKLNIFNGDGQVLSSQFAFIVATNAVGDITSWYITAQESPASGAGYQEITSYCGQITVDYSVTGYSDFSANSESSPPEGGTTGAESDAGCGSAPLIMLPSSPLVTPEPSSCFSLGTGLLGLLALAPRRRR